KLSVYEALQLMLAFATFVLLLIDKKDQKNNHLNHF
ncbi:putative holin-like toxin, partial [Enterococcus hirae]